jgi:hypothetical protein
MESSNTVDVYNPDPILADAGKRNRLLSSIHQIRDQFEKHFDRSWLSVVIDELPLEHRTVREIREFLHIVELSQDDDQRIESGLDELRRYIWTLKKHLLPQVKELLGVSAFSYGRRRMDKSQYVLRRLTAHALPYNLAQFEILVDNLESQFRAQ